MSETNVKVNIDARGVATVLLDRADRHNAFDENMIAELTATFESLASNDQLKLMILRSSGKNFSAGADLDWMKRMANYGHDENLRDANLLAQMLHTLNYLPFPTIARVQGAAMGGGAGLVCCCDIAIASDKASFAFSEARLGLIPATISPYVLQSIGAQASRRFFLTAERFDASKALALGMVSEVFAEEEMDAEVEKLVGIILANSAEAVKAAKRLIFDIENQEVNAELLQMTSERIAEIRASEEGKEGLAAFLEKRKPRWLEEMARR